MKSIDEFDPNGTEICKVTQLGVELKIDDGTITSPPNSATTIDITNSVVTFGSAGSSPVTMTGVLAPHMKAAANPTSTAAATVATAAHQWPNGSARPSPKRTDEDDWRDLFWVPHTRMDYWDSPIDPGWRTSAVTGRVVLSGGTLSGGIPSDGASVNGVWEFRRPSDGLKYQQSITDRLHYETNVPGSSVTINVQDATGTKQYVVTPVAGRKTVGLVVVGLHDGAMPIHVGDQLTHFCTFYQLIRADKRPTTQDGRLMPYFVGLSASSGGGSLPLTAGIGGPEPSPGAFCPGDWP
jgi:hypothetical protein